MLHTDAPSIGPEFSERFEQPGDCERYFVFPNTAQWIVTKWLGRVSRVQIDDAALLLDRNIRSDTLDQVSVWINEREAAPS